MITQAKLLERIPRTHNVESFRFSVTPRLNFFPGQFCQIIFDEDNISNAVLNKYLSFSSSPAKFYIEFTKKLSQSLFSQKLNGLNVGDTIKINGPFGNCVFKDEYSRICFVVGGIGITPAISIIDYIMDKKLGTDVVVVYSNRTEKDIAFRNELDNWHQINNKIKITNIVTECAPTDKRCLWGVVNKDILIKAAPDWNKRIFFVFGPPKMVGEMRKLCLDLGCQSKDVKAENFIGY